MSDSKNLGMATCAPVSPPVVVVVVSNKLGWSCQSVTPMTVAMVSTVKMAGTHHPAPRHPGGGPSTASASALRPCVAPPSTPVVPEVTRVGSGAA